MPFALSPASLYIQWSQTDRPMKMPQHKADLQMPSMNLWKTSIPAFLRSAVVPKRFASSGVAILLNAAMIAVLIVFAVPISAQQDNLQSAKIRVAVFQGTGVGESVARRSGRS